MVGIVPTGLLHFRAARTTSRGCEDVREQVEQTIEVIRPALQADGGDIFLREVDEDTGVITVSLVGACGTCPVSTDTLKAGIERIMKDRIDGVTEVVAV
jgi:Fe-S cluster biogenesis protein NfuA